ncbi:hypothetical protein ACIO3O_37545 [Streptomyces sp. NPDC087440]
MPEQTPEEVMKQLQENAERLAEETRKQAEAIAAAAQRDGGC